MSKFSKFEHVGKVGPYGDGGRPRTEGAMSGSYTEPSPWTDRQTQLKTLPLALCWLEVTCIYIWKHLTSMLLQKARILGHTWPVLRLHFKITIGTCSKIRLDYL